MRVAFGYFAIFACVACGKHLNPDWCATHQDPQCAQIVDAPSGGCAKNSDCASQACLPNGACADASSVLYVSTTGTGTACTHDAKCAFATALGLAAPTRNTIILDPGIYPGAHVIDRSLQIIGRSATLDGRGTGPVISVINATVEVDFVTITGAPNMSGLRCDSGALHAHEVNVTGNGIGVYSSCTLALDRSIVTRSPSGALEIGGGTIDVRDNFIVNNGADGMMRAANVHIGAGVTGMFAFNTVAYNDAKINTVPGVDCGSAIVAIGNLVTDNNHAGIFNVSRQTSGTCDFTKSYTQPGAGNNDLKWVDVTTSDFHLTAASTPALDSASLACTGEVDIDGDRRPLGGGCDYGADELKP